MIYKIEAGKTYRLIDKNSYLENSEYNYDYIDEYFTDNCVTIESLGHAGKGGKIGDDLVIGIDELEFFELVEEGLDEGCLGKEEGFVEVSTLTKTDLETPIYWDGESPLEVGMVVGDEGTDTVEYVCSDNKVLLKAVVGFTYLLDENQITPFDQPKVEKEAAFKTVCERFRRLSLDNAYDTDAQYKDILDIAWEVFREEEGDCTCDGEESCRTGLGWIVVNERGYTPQEWIAKRKMDSAFLNHLSEDTQEYIKSIDERLAEESIPDDNTKPIKSDGGSSSYYDITLPQWLINKIVETKTLKCEDLIEVFGSDFDEANILKCTWRINSLKRGVGKSGNSVEYDANKIIYSATRIKERGGH